jgi:hypothetical protein
VGNIWDTKPVRIATLTGFVENDRFSPPSCGPCMSYIIKHSYTFHPKKDTGWFLKNMSEVRIKLLKMFED